MHNEPYILLLAVAGPIWTDQDGQTPRACATRTTQRPSSHVTQQRRQVATVPFIHVAKFLWPSLATFARAIDLARAPCEPVGLPPSGGVARDNSAISPGSLQYINVCKSVSMHVCVCMFVCVCVCFPRESRSSVSGREKGEEEKSVYLSICITKALSSSSASSSCA